MPTVRLEDPSWSHEQLSRMLQHQQQRVLPQSRAVALPSVAKLMTQYR
jgi:hypothetical protein